MEILFFILPGFIFWWFLKSGEESGGVLKISQWYFALPFAAFGITFFLLFAIGTASILSILKEGDFSTLFNEFLTQKNKGVIPFIFTCLAAILFGKIGQHNKTLQNYMKLFIPEDRDNFDWIRRRLEEFGSLIITLKSGKVYYGVPTALTKGWGNEDVFLEINPIASGYRDKNQKVTVTNDYSKSITKELELGNFPFSVILAEREISSIVKYDENNFSFKNLLEEI
jgi:hypothetical protein